MSNILKNGSLYNSAHFSINPFRLLHFTHMEGICMFTIKTTDDANVQWIGNEKESVLDGARRNGVNIPYAVGGGCGCVKLE